MAELLTKNNSYKVKTEIKERAIAFAAICQAAALCKQLAWTGVANESNFKATISSLFTINSNSIKDIYPDNIGLKTGIDTAINMLSKNIEKDKEIMRYTFSLVHVERKLMKNTDMQNIIKKGISSCQRQMQYFNDLLHPNVIANLAGIYSDTVSNFKFRIQVLGKTEHLQQKFVLNKVRAILLAGIRAAILWHQLGGRRWQILFTKSYYLDALQEIKTSL